MFAFQPIPWNHQTINAWRVFLIVIFFIYYGLFKIIESKSESELQSGQENLQKPAKKRLLSHKNFLQSIIYNDRSADTIQLVMVQNQKCDVSNFNFGIFQARSFSRLV